MNIEQLIADLRARVNPQYYDQIGTESYERHQVVKALEYLATENERLKEAQQQPAVAWMIHEYQGTGEKRLQFQPHIPSIRDDVTGPIVTALYARPVPSAPAVAAPYVPFSDDDMAEVHQLAYELGGTDGGEYILDGEQLDQVIVKAASLFYKPAVAVPAVSEDFQIAAQNLIDAAGTSTCSPTRCQYPMDCCKMELIGAMDAVSALLQSMSSGWRRMPNG